jgi:biopolymer transport protein ExbB
MIEILFVRCGAIGWLLWGLSIVTVALIVQSAITIRRANILPGLLREQIQGMFDNRQYREVIDLTETEPSFLSCVIHAALAEAAHGYPAMERAMEEAAEERTTKMLRSIEWLNLLGNVGPMLGLMGTVWGMIRAFFTMVDKGGDVNAADLAGDIGVALVTTLLGLSVAIPALTVFSIMRNKIDALTSEAMTTSQELVSAFRPAGQGG